MQGIPSLRSTALLLLALLLPAAHVAHAHGYYPPTTDSGNAVGWHLYSPDLEPPSAMAGFKFDWWGDHHIRGLSSGYDWSDSQWGPLLMASIAYADNCRQDAFYWQYTHRKLPQGTTVHRAYGTGRGTSSALVKQWAYGVHPVILGFRLNFRNGDHHLTGMKVDLRLDGGEVWLDTGFYENGNDEDYDYVVTYALVQVSQLNYNLPQGNYYYYLWGSGTGYAATPISAVYPALQAFNIQFTDGDHHVDEVGVDVSQSQVRVWLNDKNDRAPFWWNVRYVDFDE